MAPARRARALAALALAAVLAGALAQGAGAQERAGVGAGRAGHRAGVDTGAGSARAPGALDWRRACDTADLLGGRDDDPAFAERKWAKKEVEAYCAKCATTHRMLAAYAAPEYAAPRRALVVDGLLRWHGIGNTASMWEPVWTLAATTRRAVYLRLSDCELSTKHCLFDMGDYFRGFMGMDWQWDAGTRADVEARLGAIDGDSNVHLWVDDWGMLYANATATPPPEQGLSMGHTVQSGRLVAFSEHSREQWMGMYAEAARERFGWDSAMQGLPEPLDYLRSPEIDAAPVVTLRLAAMWGLHNAVAFHPDYATPWRKEGERSSDALPEPERMELGCLSFAMFRPRPAFQGLLAPYLKLADEWDGISYVHSRLGVTDWIGERRHGAVADILGKAAEGVPLQCPWENDMAHLAALENVMAACGPSGREKPVAGDWRQPCVAWSEVGCKAVCRGPEHPDPLEAGEAPTAALARACSLGKDETWSMPAHTAGGQAADDASGRGAGPLHAGLTCAGRLAQGAAGGGDSERWGIVLLTDVPSLSAIYARMGADEASPLHGHAMAPTYGTLGHMRTRADEASCSARSGCVASGGRDPQGIWTRTALDYYLGGVASYGVQLVHSSFFNAITRRSTLFVRRELWLGYERMSAPHVSDDGEVTGRHGDRDSQLANATLVKVLTLCTDVPGGP